MDTPICDFVQQYSNSNPARLHMPGHKGTSLLGCEAMDITEISGADSLYEASGIIRQSEENAGSIFGCHSFYSTEGSSLSIRAMLYLAMLQAKAQGKVPVIAAGRNAHKSFLTAAALLDLNIKWICPNASTYLSCPITPEVLKAHLLESETTAVYVTSPDYLGNMLDIQGLAEVCHAHGIPLLVDNAHGAYLKFLPKSQHPMDLGADMCCDSAHKTLPVLTGGAYLHICKQAPEIFIENVRKAMSLFGSTSPSYLILQSLDKANAVLASDFDIEVQLLISKVTALKANLCKIGYTFIGNEPLKLTIDGKKYGYSGTELADILRNSGIECEFSDPDYLVLMLSPSNGYADLNRLENALTAIPKRAEICEHAPLFRMPDAVISPRTACFSPAEMISIDNAEGRILATPSVGCPPAVPILVCGERITNDAIDAFRYYGITHCDVVIV